MHKIAPFLTSAIFALSLSAPALAGGEGGLYPGAPPPGSAFVRFINGGGAGAAAIRGKAYKAVPPGAAGAYVPVPQGAADLSFGGKAAAANLKEGVHYTAVFSRGRLAVLEEPPANNRLKAEILLVNLSAAPAVSLRTADGAASVVDPVAPGALGARAVNPVRAGFAVYANGKKVSEVPALPLERGARYTALVYDAPGGTAVTFGKAEGS
jgi:hypothetical protein